MFRERMPPALTEPEDFRLLPYPFPQAFRYNADDDCYFST